MTSRQPTPPLDTDDVLQKVASLPLSLWRYRHEPPDVLHLGPMSQDFSAAFGLGTGDDRICVVDGLGVALASIQALHARLEGLTGTFDGPGEHTVSSVGAVISPPASPAVWRVRRPVVRVGAVTAGLLALGLAVYQARKSNLRPRPRA